MKRVLCGCVALGLLVGTVALVMSIRPRERAASMLVDGPDDLRRFVPHIVRWAVGDDVERRSGRSERAFAASRVPPAWGGFADVTRKHDTPAQNQLGRRS